MSKKSMKGGEFERVIAKRLSLWWTNNARDDIFWRSSCSGGRATIRAKNHYQTKNMHGDISYTDDAGKPFIDQFLVEIKCGYSKELSVLALLDTPDAKHLLTEFWKQAERDRERAGRPHSLLIFKRDRKKCCIAVRVNLFRKFERWCGACSCFNIKISHVCNAGLILVPFEAFLEWVNPEVIKRWNSSQSIRNGGVVE